MSYITAIGTAVPAHQFSQEEIARFMAKSLSMDEVEKRKLYALYKATKIQQRHSVLADYGQKSPEDYTFYPQNEQLEPFPSVAARMALYKQYALPLCLKALAAIPVQQITHLITVSCTGMYAPGLDIALVNHLALAKNVKRTAINFMGCYGAFNGLKVANDICLAHPTAQVLVVCVELCTLHFQKKKEADFLLSNALFADGAAAVLVESTPRQGQVSIALEDFYCDLCTEGQQDMAWSIGDFGFEMTLTSYVPTLLKKGIKQLIDKILSEAQLSPEAIKHYAIHPGGRAILEATEQALGLDTQANYYAYQVLKNYGNMSSCTILFVLAAFWQNLGTEHHNDLMLACAFGPGLTIESALCKVVAQC